jgi:hypothetical protein
MQLLVAALGLALDRHPETAVHCPCGRAGGASFNYHEGAIIADGGGAAAHGEKS